MIKKVSLLDDFQLYAQLLNETFAIVAKDFGLTKENSPTNNAFVTARELKEQLTENRELFYIEGKDRLLGFVAIEQAKRDAKLFYIEKLAVHPDFRHRGLGKYLMEFASSKIEKVGGKTISVGLINSNEKLKNWYASLGYKEIGLKAFEHLPFIVCYMEKYLE